jgi:hypothetical protein
VGRVTRRLRFAPDAMRIEDRIEGTGTRRVTRRLHTILPARIEEGGVVLEGRRARYRVRADSARLAPGTCWTAYGVGVKATVIEIEARQTLPFAGAIEVEAHAR